MIVLYPIKPNYINSILEGNKKYELRRRLPKLRPEYIVLYSTSPIAMVVGYATVKDIHCKSTDELWELVSEGAAIEQDDYFEYFQGTNKAYAFEFEQVYQFNRPFPINHIADDYTVPQSFSYVNSNEFKRISRRRASLV